MAFSFTCSCSGSLRVANTSSISASMRWKLGFIRKGDYLPAALESALFFTGCISMPHSGHLPGVVLVLSGCMGHAYCVQVLGSSLVLFSVGLPPQDEKVIDRKRSAGRVRRFIGFCFE